MTHPEDQCTRCGGKGHTRSECKWPTCTDCETAAKQLWAGFWSECKGCQVRALAIDQDYWESARDKRLKPAYQKALKGIFGDDWATGHDLVKQWAKTMKGYAC